MKYFAYGSNMNPDRMRQRGINFSMRIHAVLEGFRLEFNKVSSKNPKEGYANIIKNNGGIVEGILYEIQDTDLPKLDRREGYPNHYSRIQVMVQLDDGEKVESNAFIARTDKVKIGLKPSREYMAHMLKGCDVLSNDYCAKLRSFETLD